MPISAPRPLVLASTSAYRRELLERLQLPFDTLSPAVDETPLPGETPVDLAMRLAAAKARAGVLQRPGALVIGADQVATLADGPDAGQPIGKPDTLAAAVAQLQSMRGRTVLFHSAMALDDGARQESVDVVTRVRFRQLSDTQIHHYLQAEAVLDTAGSAKVEGLGIALMDRIDSDDPTALIGLPLIALTRLLASFGMDPLGA